MIYQALPFLALTRTQRLSERSLGRVVNLSRGVLRQLLGRTSGNLTLGSLSSLADFFRRDVEVLITPPDIRSEYSTVAVALSVERDGFESWKIHFFNLVDEFRRTLDPRLTLLPPPKSLAPELTSLLAAIVKDLSEEVGMAPPPWALKRRFLPRPWFVSGINSLKASALLESPLHYRANNIFVHSNFLARA